jgi:hypothetical protein
MVAPAGKDSGDDVLLADVALDKVLDGHARGMGQLGGPYSRFRRLLS